jgi:hypothetical protein
VARLKPATLELVGAISVGLAENGGDSEKEVTRTAASVDRMIVGVGERHVALGHTVEFVEVPSLQPPFRIHAHFHAIDSSDHCGV